MRSGCLMRDLTVTIHVKHYSSTEWPANEDQKIENFTFKNRCMFMWLKRLQSEMSFL